MSIEITFQPWGHFRAVKDNSSIQAWLDSIGEAAEAAFRGGMGSYPPASAPGAWPNTRSGGLIGSIAHETTSNSVTIGTSMPYSGFLRSGTSRMARRKMSDNALQEGMKAGAGRLGHWVHWSRG
jgi:hypothetical protein